MIHPASSCTFAPTPFQLQRPRVATRTSSVQPTSLLPSSESTSAQLKKSTAGTEPASAEKRRHASTGGRPASITPGVFAPSAHALS
eukprot:1974464-Pleurochrysis_carterae.AAC.2